MDINIKIKIMTYISKFYLESSVNNIEIPLITFPKNEHIDIKKRLNDGLDVSTIRVSTEYNKYKLGNTYITEWGDIVKIIECKQLSKLEQYTFYKYNKKKLEKLNKFKLIERLKLKKII